MPGRNLCDIASSERNKITSLIASSNVSKSARRKTILDWQASIHDETQRGLSGSILRNAGSTTPHSFHIWMELQWWMNTFKALGVKIRGSSCQQSYCYVGSVDVQISKSLFTKLGGDTNHCFPNERYEACHTIHIITWQSSYLGFFSSDKRSSH